MNMDLAVAKISGDGDNLAATRAIMAMVMERNEGKKDGKGGKLRLFMENKSFYGSSARENMKYPPIMTELDSLEMK